MLIMTIRQRMSLVSNGLSWRGVTLKWEPYLREGVFPIGTEKILVLEDEQPLNKLYNAY